MNNYDLCNYQNEWAIFCKQSNCYVLFGSKKQMKNKLKQLKDYEYRIETRKINSI
jgi:hypothetical protein